MNRGDWEAISVPEPSVLALRYRTEGSELVALHNLGADPVRAHGIDASSLEDAFSNRAYDPPGRVVELDGYGFRWLRTADA